MVEVVRRVAVAVTLLAPMVLGGCAGQDAGPVTTDSVATFKPVMPAIVIPSTTAPATVAPAPVSAIDVPSAAAPRKPRPPKVSAKKLTHTLDRFLARYGGRLTAMVHDLTTDRIYGYHRSLQLPTASTSKVGILMALLLKTRWHKLSGQTRREAERMIRFSDNRAADRLYVRIGLESGLAAANRKFGLKRTYTPAGRCVDLYCWGITQTTAEDQIRLIRALVTGKSPLAEEDRRRVLRLMERVTSDQKWGISAAACRNDVVSLKNGWLRHVSNKRWAVVSAGLIRGDGHDYAVAVLTEDSGSMGTGIAKVEGAAKRILAAFRGKQGCGTSAR